jgi:hypothetical protein
MSTNYDDATQLVNENQLTSAPEVKAPQEEPVTGKTSGWRKVAMNGGAGLFVGVVASTLMGMKNPETDPAQAAENENGALTHPEWTDGEVQVAAGVNDDMSFGEAFAAARQEVGPGGVFEWHGQIYGTYYADEWNNMSAEERAEYENHFSWNHIDASESDVTTHQTSASYTSGGSAASETASVEHHTPDPTPSNDDDIEVVHVDPTHPDGQTTPVVEVDPTPSTVPGDDSGVEVLGVYHDDSNGANLAHLEIDGHNAVMVDVDGDMVFDAMAEDLNDDGQISDNEVADIHDVGITVEHLGGFTDDALMASHDAGMDVNDGAYEG